jgi:hypothetical protein
MRRLVSLLLSVVLAVGAPYGAGAVTATHHLAARMAVDCSCPDEGNACNDRDACGLGVACPFRCFAPAPAVMADAPLVSAEPIGRRALAAGDAAFGESDAELPFRPPRS